MNQEKEESVFDQTKVNVGIDAEEVNIDTLLRKYDVHKIFDVNDNKMNIKTEFKGLYDSDIQSIISKKMKGESKNVVDEVQLKADFLIEYYTNTMNCMNNFHNHLHYKTPFYDYIRKVPYKTKGICVNLNTNANKSFNDSSEYTDKLLSHDKFFCKKLRNIEIIPIKEKLTEIENKYMETCKHNKITAYIMGSRTLEAIYSDSVQLTDSDMDVALYFSDWKMNHELKYKLINQWVDNFIQTNKNYSYELVKGTIDTKICRHRITNNITKKIIEVFIIPNHPYYVVKNFHLSWIRMYYDVSKRKLVMLPSCLYTILTGQSTYNDNISAGKKKIEILYKYAKRGFNIFLGPEDKKLFDEYAKLKEKEENSKKYEPIKEEILRKNERTFDWLKNNNINLEMLLNDPNTVKVLQLLTEQLKK